NYYRRAKYIGERLIKAPSVRAVYGVGYPFYGKTHLKQMTFVFLVRVIRGLLSEDDFLQHHVLQDADMLIVYGGDPRKLPPRPQPKMAQKLRDYFVDEATPMRRLWDGIL